jgi:hypothetical protein
VIGSGVPMSRRRKILLGVVIAGVVVGGAIQLVPVQGIGSNPPERFQVDAPPEVQAILRRACFDCHSNETRWPLYSRLAPGSWLMSRDITKGRSHMNFSKWGEADEEERALDRKNAWEQIEEGNMPPWFYIYPLHLDARLSDADKAALKAWLTKPAPETAPVADTGPSPDAGAKSDGK